MKWFINTFLPSFESGTYYCYWSRISPFEFKCFMNTVKSNNWKTLTEKQFEIIKRYLKEKECGIRHSYYQFSNDEWRINVDRSEQTFFCKVEIIKIAE